MLNEHKETGMLLILISGEYNFQCWSFRMGEMMLLCKCDFYMYA